ncbi:Signal transduction histidine kinase [Hyunsoonleella jejuensis]|uniref:Oxygen sensor histidine kinase NreB n=1 Tax=Hyunsoonleella jejuensis TaxID=419940 RepID=A0A1H9C9D6_9FLAO|nr:Signal transduction histidine kinase [Hyunsoonleella jejuensis]
MLDNEIQDSLSIAKAHYNIGELYRFSFIGDSAYYYYFKADKIFKKLNNSFFSAKTLYGIAVAQKNEKDFTASEVTSIEALSILNQLEPTYEVKKYKSYVYNNLGLLFGELEQFEESISYHEKAISLKQEYDSENSYNINISRNNLALSYKKWGKYELAIRYYGDILSKKSLKKERPNFYSLVLDNYAHTQYLNGNLDNLPELYFKALRVADSINPEGGYNSIIINQHLANFYFDKDEIDSARYYANTAKEIAENYSNDELLTSLLVLSKVEDGEKAVEHLKAYVKLSDSLQKAERKIRNKFARIRFETQQIEQENIRIARERMWLVIISIILLVAGVLIYIIITQRAKNKELQFAKQQQEANEEIYNLMLGEHEKVEEARALEKQRISQELHDGVLGRLFGTRLSLDSLNMNNSDEAIKTRSQYIGELKTIEEDIRKVSHELNTDFVSGSGFIDILKTMVETQTTVYKLKYDIYHDDDINWDGVSNKSKIHIYRILQESLHNIHKHANATYIIISIKLENNVICLTVKDDGSGFDMAKSKSGIGLKNMNARIAEIGGSLKIESEKNQGTTVRIEIPTKYL